MFFCRHSSQFSPPEMELIKRILKEIVSSETGAVSSIDCINYSADIPKLTKSDAQVTMDKLKTSLWVKEVRLKKIFRTVLSRRVPSWNLLFSFVGRWKCVSNSPLFAGTGAVAEKDGRTCRLQALWNLDREGGISEQWNQQIIPLTSIDSQLM